MYILGGVPAMQWYTNSTSSDVVSLLNCSGCKFTCSNVGLGPVFVLKLWFYCLRQKVDGNVPLEMLRSMIT
jgi:hypothetical protein